MKALEINSNRDCRGIVPGRRPKSAGMTLLELTVVILVLLSLISILFVGAQAWKRGSDRSICIINIQNVQKGLRGFSNIYGYETGTTVTGLQSQIIGLDRFLTTTPNCPGGGAYVFGQVFGVDTIPPIGTLYMECSLSATDEHEPQDFSDW